MTLAPYELALIERDLDRLIHEVPVGSGRPWISAIAAGGGARLGAILTERPGSSILLSDFLVPYSEASFKLALQPAPDYAPLYVQHLPHVSRPVAVELARSALAHAKSTAPKRQVVPVGLAVTAAIATDRPKRGELHVWAAASTDSCLATAHVIFPRKPVMLQTQTSPRTWHAEGSYVSVLGRQVEDDWCVKAGLFVLARACCPGPLDTPGWALGTLLTSLPALLNCDDASKPDDGVRIEFNSSVVAPLTIRNPDGKEKDIRSIWSVDPPFSAAAVANGGRRIFYPGSFNPLHDGHRGVVDAVERFTGREVTFLLSTNHAHKGLLSEDELQQRLRQFEWYRPVLIDRQTSLFIDRLGLGDFVVGADVFRQVFDPKFGPSVDEMLRAIQDKMPQIFVARRNGENVAQICHDLGLNLDIYTGPTTRRPAIFDVPFDSSLSSTAIREG